MTTPTIPELQADIRTRSICPWCFVAVRVGAIGGMEPFLLRGVYFHKGCLADQYRSELESQQP